MEMEKRRMKPYGDFNHLMSLLRLEDATPNPIINSLVFPFVSPAS